MAKKIKTYSQEELNELNLQRDLNEIKKKIDKNILPLNPTKHFKVNQRVQFGAIKETYVREIGENELYYLVEHIGIQRTRDKKIHNEKMYVEWIDLYPLKNKSTSFRQEEKYRIRYVNSGIRSLLNMVYHFGVDFDVDYQRGYVWSMKDKLLLIDSIFNNIEIGKFVFIERSLGCEVLLNLINDILDLSSSESVCGFPCQTHMDIIFLNYQILIKIK